MDFYLLLDWIKENSWFLGSGGVVGLVVLLKSFWGKLANTSQSIKSGENSINIQASNDINFVEINNVRKTKNRNGR